MLKNHYDKFEHDYAERFELKHGFFRPVSREVVQEYLDCGDLKQGFARVRCPDYAHEYLLAFSCKARWFCPSCHTKKVIEFGERLGQSILYPVPHRQYVFAIPILLRVYLKYDRRLLSKLCRSAYEGLLIFLRTTMQRPSGVPGVVMAIQTFGEYPDRFHPHLHALVSDGLFKKTGTFCMMPQMDLKFLEEICSGLQFSRIRASMRSQSAGKIRGFIFVRRRSRAKRWACFGRYPRFPEFRFNSRPIVDLWTLRRVAISA